MYSRCLSQLGETTNFREYYSKRKRENNAKSIGQRAYKRMSKIRENKFREIIKHIEIKPNIKILDVGCGDDDTFLRLLRSKHPKVHIDYTASDISENKKKYFKKRGIPFVKLDVTQEKTRNQYDYVIFSEVIEHLPSPYNALLNVRSMLKRDGIVIGTTPNLGSLRHIFNYLISRENDSEEHLIGFNAKVIENMCKLVGFKKVQIYSFGSWLPKTGVYLGVKYLGEYLIFIAHKE